jgi:hypothetical protein
MHGLSDHDYEALRRSIGLGKAYLRHCLHKGAYGLSCKGNLGEEKFSNNKGHLFSSYFIRSALGAEITEIDRVILLTRVLSEEFQGKWGYSPRGYYREDRDNPFFTDADDSAFALRTLRMLGIYRDARLFRDYLVETILDSQKAPAFTTFQSASKNKQVFSLHNFENNFNLHPEVNANVYHAILDSHMDDYISPDFIRFTQRSSGFWQSFFYPEPLYATYQFVSLIRKLGICAAELDKALHAVWAAWEEQKASGIQADPWLTAMTLLCLNSQKLSTLDLKEITFALVLAQKESGAWVTEKKIWVFHDQDDCWNAWDSNHVIATSFAVMALENIIKM